jgi:hypothetical protein
VAPVQPLPAAPDEGRDANRTREEFHRVLEKHPPSLGRVLKLDPALMHSPDYLATYPAVSAFLARHPEVARDPGYFLAGVRAEADDRPQDARTQAYRAWERMTEGALALCVMATIVGSLIWLIRTMIDYRRWGRLSKVQQDVHTKLLDRFTSNDDLMAYMRTPAGERFLQSAPIALDGDARPMAAPMRRILWGIQAGMVLLAGGVGLQFVSRRVLEDMSGAVSAVGILAGALGVGFLAAAAASYQLSRRLGLIDAPPPAPVAGPGTEA